MYVIIFFYCKHFFSGVPLKTPTLPLVATKMRHIFQQATSSIKPEILSRCGRTPWYSSYSCWFSDCSGTSRWGTSELPSEVHLTNYPKFVHAFQEKKYCVHRLIYEILFIVFKNLLNGTANLQQISQNCLSSLEVVLIKKCIVLLWLWNSSIKRVLYSIFFI